jgi:PhoH-like protein
MVTAHSNTLFFGTKRAYLAMRHTATSKTYLSFLPLGNDHLDMFAIFNGIMPQVTKWVELFYGHANFETDLHTEHTLADSVRHFYFESKNQLKTRGQQPFGFGFPTVFDRDEAGNEVVAPLFIWYLTIKPHPTRRDSWLLSFDDNSPVVVNDYLVEHIRQKTGDQIGNHLNSYAHTRPFGYDGFKAFCSDLAERLHFSAEQVNTALRPMPSASLRGELCDRGDLAWMGAIGMFPHPDGSLFESETQSIDFQNFTWTADHAHEFGILPEDAEQREALRTVLRNKITVVEGAHGTGKTHLATNILFNALSNGQRTAVVANDLASLMQIQNEFVKLGLGNLTFLLKDVYHDKKLLLDVLRNEQYGKTVDYNPEEFNITVKQARRLLSKSDDSHDALSRPVFGEEPFSEVVGRYLASQRKAGRELLANHLNSSDFDFTKEEFTALQDLIQTSQTAFSTVNTLKHPLSNVHATTFAGNSSSESQTAIEGKLAHFVKRFKALQHQAIAVNDAYAQRLMTHYENHYLELREQLRHLREAHSDHQYQYGKDFESSNLLKVTGLYASSLFNDRSKNILTAKDEVVKRYDDLEGLFVSRKHFVHDFLKGSDKKDFAKFKLNLETFDLQLKGWRKALPSTVQEELQRLNAKVGQHFDKNLAEEIREIEVGLDELLEELNKSEIYTEPLSHKMLTLPKRMLFIEEVIEKLQETQLNLRDFDTFFDWQKHWLSLPDNGRKLVSALVKVRPLDWSAAFQSWYFYNILVVHYQSNTLSNDGLRDAMNESEDRLRTLLPNQIASLWNEKKKEAIRLMKSKNTSGFKYFFSEKNQQLAKGKYLREILRGGIATLSDIYPVLLVTPQVATHIIESEGKEFDVVIFDNAQNIEPEQVVPILRNTEGVVVLSEYAASDGMLVNSLAAKLKMNNAATVRLNHLHRAVSATSRRINQAIFYPTLNVPFQQLTAEQSVIVKPMTNANYNPTSKMNGAEIVGVMQVLEEISATPFNTYPRVGVVAMTRQQRNSLNANLLNHVQKTLFGWEKIEQLQRNGLGVYAISELAGMQFDILVVSGTFSDFNDFTIPKAEFRQLLNSFTKKLYWVNSISNAHLEAATQDRRNEMPFLLSNLIQLGKLIQLGDTPQYEGVFQNLSNLYGKTPTSTDSSFVSEICRAVEPALGAGRLQTNYLIDNQLFPLVVLPAKTEDKPIVLRIDGKISNAGNYFSADWERKLLRGLDAVGIKVVSVWSYNWWKEPQVEAARLVVAVEKIDRDREPQPIVMKTLPEPDAEMPTEIAVMDIETLSNLTETLPELEAEVPVEPAVADVEMTSIAEIDETIEVQEIQVHPEIELLEAEEDIIAEITASETVVSEENAVEEEENAVHQIDKSIIA